MALDRDHRRPPQAPRREDRGRRAAVPLLIMSDVSPQVLVIAGPNGAGKTTLSPFLLRDTFGLTEYVNADSIALGLSAFRPEAVTIEAGRVMLRRLRELASQGKNFAFETTLATR